MGMLHTSQNLLCRQTVPWTKVVLLFSSNWVLRGVLGLLWQVMQGDAS